MRKLSYTFMLMLGILSTFLVIDEFNESYFLKVADVAKTIQQQGQKSGVYAQLSASGVNLTHEEFVNKLMDFSDENKISIIAERPLIDLQNREISLKLVHSNNLNLNESLYFKEKVDFDFSNRDEDKYYTTDVLDGSNNAILIKMLSKKYYDGINTSIIQIRPFNQFLDVFPNEESFYINFYGDDASKMIDLISVEFSVPKEEIGLITPVPIMKMDSPLVKLVGLIGVLVIILIVCEINKRMKEVSVRKLNGNSLSQILKKLILKLACIGILSFLIGMICIFVILVKEVSMPIIEVLLKILLFIVGCYLLITIITCVIVKFTTIAINIKKTHTNYKMLTISLLIKLMLMLVIIVPFISTFDRAYESSILLKNLVKYYDLSKYQYSLELNTNYTDWEKYEQDSKRLYDAINENGAIYVDASRVEPREFDMEYGNNLFIPILCVNKNYLKDYKIKLEDGSILNLDDIEKNTYLVPRQHQGKQYAFNFNVQEYNTLVVKEGMTYYNPTIYSETTFVNDPVILLVDEYINNIQLYYPNIYVLNENSTKETLKNEGLENAFRLYDTTGWVNNRMEYYIEIVSAAAITLSLYTMMLVLFLYQSVFTYMEEIKKHISVQYLLGHNSFSRYNEIIVMNLAPHAFFFMISVIFFSVPIKLIFNFCIVFMVIELLFMIYIIKKFERNAVISVLKGE